MDKFTTEELLFSHSIDTMELKKQLIMKWNHCIQLKRNHGSLFVSCLQVNSDFMIMEQGSEIFESK